MIKQSANKPCTVNMYGSTNLRCTFASADIHGCEFLVENLETPTGETYTSALLRANDIIAISIDDTTQTVDAESKEI